MAGSGSRPQQRTRAKTRSARTRTWAAMAQALILAALSIALWPAASLATPTPPVILVNHGAKECSEVLQGDDCSWCEPPPGWEVLGRAGEVTCPEEYARVDAPAMNCRRYETPFCCSGGVHRGDCEDMVIDHAAATCGFVDDSEGCTLPGNWQGRPAGIEPQDWACPAGYGWAPQPIPCLDTAGGNLEATAAVPAGDADATGRGICVGVSCLGLAALLFGLAAMFPVWYVARQKAGRMRPPSPRR